MKDFKVEKAVKLLVMRFPSKVDNIDNAVKYTADFVTSLNKSINTFELKVVLSEAITNAVVHGNKENEKEKISIKITLTDRTIVIRVKDNGRGFNWQQRLESDDLPEDDFAESGRGIALIRAYGYRITFNREGNVMFLEKDLEPLKEQDD